MKILSILALLASLSSLAWAAPNPQRGGGRWGDWQGDSDSVNTVNAITTTVGPAVHTGGAVPPASTGGVVPAALPGGFGGESHSVHIFNNCPSGRPVFLYRNNGVPQGSTTVQGPLYGGVAWLDGFVGPAGTCGSSGVNCGTVEFSLINKGTDGANTHNSINYSLQSQGNHQWSYPMHFRYTDRCGGAPGACTSAATCPGAFVGFDTASGTPVDCEGTNEGIVITFC